MSAQLTLTADELQALTGYRRASEQLRELHRRGYWRACRSITGAVVLTREHFGAIERGEDKQAPQQRPAPRLRAAA